MGGSPGPIGGGGVGTAQGQFAWQKWTSFQVPFACSVYSMNPQPPEGGFVMIRLASCQPRGSSADARHRRLFAIRLASVVAVTCAGSGVHVGLGGRSGNGGWFGSGVDIGLSFVIMGELGC